MTNSRAKAIYVVKKVSETVNNSTTMQDDNELLFKVKSSRIYSGYILLYIDSGTTPDFKFQLTGPSGATASIGNGNVDSVTGIAATAISTAITSLQIAGANQLFIPFTVTISTTAGTINLQWAQNTQDASDTKVQVGSHIIVFESL